MIIIHLSIEIAASKKSGKVSENILITPNPFTPISPKINLNTNNMLKHKDNLNYNN